jgi:hypothetical protein
MPRRHLRSRRETGYDRGGPRWAIRGVKGGVNRPPDVEEQRRSNRRPHRLTRGLPDATGRRMERRADRGGCVAGMVAVEMEGPDGTANTTGPVFLDSPRKGGQNRPEHDDSSGTHPNDADFDGTRPGRPLQAPSIRRDPPRHRRRSTVDSRRCPRRRRPALLGSQQGLCLAL